MSSIKDSLGDRIKSYEDAYRISLPIRMPIVIRIDGKAFHSYTKGCERPVDERLVDCMNETATYLCKNVQGCMMAYVQSDEISLLLNNFRSLDTQPWFDNTLQKMVSVAAAMASAIFTANSWKVWSPKNGIYPKGDDALDYVRPAMFDARAFILPKEEVCNYFIWRQQDATRNSVQMLARTLYSHKQCTDKDNSELQELIFQKGINWNDCPIPQRRGRCLVKTQVEREGTNHLTGEKTKVLRSEWVVDNEIPIFTQDRKYIDRFLEREQENDREQRNLSC